jgi:repressor LexA
MTSKKFKGQKEFTDRQVRLLNFIQSFDRKHGYAPSVREMRDKAGYSSPSMVHRDLCQLEALSFIERVSRIARGSRVCKAVRSKSRRRPDRPAHRPGAAQYPCDWAGGRWQTCPCACFGFQLL